MTSQEQSLIKTICPAIQSCHLIRFWYKNKSGRQEWRLVEPYLLGAFPQKNIQLTAWLLPSPEQILSGQTEGWRSYLLKSIADLEIMQEKFTVRRDFDPSTVGIKDPVCVATKEFSPLKIV